MSEFDSIEALRQELVALKGSLSNAEVEIQRVNVHSKSFI